MWICHCQSEGLCKELAKLIFNIRVMKESILISEQNCFIRRPSQVADWYTFVNPIRKHGWFIIFALIFCCSVMLQIAYYFSRTKTNCERYSLNVLRTTFETMAVLTQQGSELIPIANSTRLTFITIYVISVIVFALYSASLTSFLLVIKLGQPFDDLETLYRDTDYKIGSVSGTLYPATWYQQGDELEQRVYRERYEEVPSIKAGLEKALTENYAFVWDEVVIDQRVGLCCSHISPPKPTYDTYMVNLFKKDYEYQEYINHL